MLYCKDVVANRSGTEVVMIVFTASLRFDDVPKIAYVRIECDKVDNYFLCLSFSLYSFGSLEAALESCGHHKQ